MDSEIARIVETIRRAKNCSAVEAAHALARERGVVCFWCRGLNVRKDRCPDCNKRAPTPSDIFASVHISPGLFTAE